jgi:hypothetical protein
MQSRGPHVVRWLDCYLAVDANLISCLPVECLCELLMEFPHNDRKDISQSEALFLLQTKHLVWSDENYEEEDMEEDEQLKHQLQYQRQQLHQQRIIAVMKLLNFFLQKLSTARYVCLFSSHQ